MVKIFEVKVGTLFTIKTNLYYAIFGQTKGIFSKVVLGFHNFGVHVKYIVKMLHILFAVCHKGNVSILHNREHIQYNVSF
jgi:hypothetical protein